LQRNITNFEIRGSLGFTLGKAVIVGVLYGLYIWGIILSKKKLNYKKHSQEDFMGEHIKHKKEPKKAPQKTLKEKREEKKSKKKANSSSNSN